MYKKVDQGTTLVKMEKQTLKFWKGNNIVQKNFDLNKDGENFTFYDGPPTANGNPHMGHVLTRAIKDVIPRYKVMKGYYVPRKGGLDTHGLPVEIEIEKALGISGKPDIERYGVEGFVKECKKSVDKYSNMWKEMSTAIGYWVDMDNPYVTYHNSYIESVWWALKELWNKNLLYKGYKVLHYCPRCGTTLSSNEVSQGHKDVTDNTAVVKFKVKNAENKYMLAWTTTPWTLPCNMALTVNKKYDYVEAKVSNETFIVAKELAPKVLKNMEYEIVKEFKGADLLGTEYEQLFTFEKPEGKAHYVIHGDFVTLTDGTGIVHTAPAYGEDDNVVCNQNNIPLMNLVDTEGKFMDEVTPWAGMFVKDADSKIIDFMRENGMLFSSEKYTHSYPHCWRCDTPLLFYPRDSWFVNTTSIKNKLIDNNNKINWLPDNVRTGRFGNFLGELRDWGISRDRYWGTPLPIWQCECGHLECVGSIEELQNKGITVPDNLDLHKPYIDNVKLKCSKCGGEMTRTREVIDCWFDSGSMPFAQYHYPFENKEVFEANFPAQFISEAIDQTRGWFYNLLAISTALFGTTPFENCIVLGHVLDKNGLKMSKHKGNFENPMEVIEAQGADAVRWYFYTSNLPWFSTKFSKEAVAESKRGFLDTLWNVYSFYVLYAELDQFNPTKYECVPCECPMDKWILTKLNALINTVETYLDSYRITEGAKAIENFVDDLSNWYVRRNRARFWNSELTADKISAYVTLHKVLVEVSKIASPFVPFIAEEIYQNLVTGLNPNAPESIHLCSWPKYDPNFYCRDLEKDMDLTYKIVKLGRNARNLANVKNRQPLSKMLINVASLPEYYKSIIKDELNIKELQFNADLSKYVNFEIKPNLPMLGKNYGKLIPEIKKFISSQNQMELAQTIQNGGYVTANVQGTDITLTSENLLVTMQGLDGYAFASFDEVGIVLDTSITDELKEEGNLREIISKLQNLRKENGLEVSDKINLYVSGNEALINIIKKFSKVIMKETLTTAITYNTYRDCTQYNINGNHLYIEVVKCH